jgi:vacuolar-type H+-ATPase subunit I/STV1
LKEDLAQVRIEIERTVEEAQQVTNLTKQVKRDIISNEQQTAEYQKLLKKKSKHKAALETKISGQLLRFADYQSEKASGQLLLLQTRISAETDAIDQQHTRQKEREVDLQKLRFVYSGLSNLGYSTQEQEKERHNNEVVMMINAEQRRVKAVTADIEIVSSSYLQS